MGIERDTTATEELIRLPAGGAFIITDEHGDELFRVTAANDRVKINGVTISRDAADAIAAASAPSDANPFATMADALADGFGTAGATTEISGTTGGSGQAGATLVIAGGGGDGNGEAPYHGARVILNANADDGSAGTLELEGGDSDGRVSVRNPSLSGSFLISGLPTSNPAVEGQVWNDGGTLKVSAG